MKGRFAPSPTGHIHLGNVWIALLSYISTKSQEGKFLVRMEDIDLQRSKRSLGESLLDDLEWLGFEWDEGPRVGGPLPSYWQCDRYENYEEVIRRWHAEHKVYPCFCNRSRLQNIGSAPHIGEIVYRYDGHCRNLTVDEVAEREKEKSPSWRLKVDDSTISFRDRWCGMHQVQLHKGGDDFIIRRSDGMFAYNLAVVLDDIEMGITEVIRGRDLLDSTGQQLYIYELLKERAPLYGHAPLLVDGEGNRLSKRQKSITIVELRASGYSKERIFGELVRQCSLIPEKALRKNGTISLKELLRISLDEPTLYRGQIVVKPLQHNGMDNNYFL